MGSAHETRQWDDKPGLVDDWKNLDIDIDDCLEGTMVLKRMRIGNILRHFAVPASPLLSVIQKLSSSVEEHRFDNNIGSQAHCPEFNKPELDCTAVAFLQHLHNDYLTGSLWNHPVSYASSQLGTSFPLSIIIQFLKSCSLSQRIDCLRVTEHHRSTLFHLLAKSEHPVPARELQEILSLTGRFAETLLKVRNSANETPAESSTRKEMRTLLAKCGRHYFLNRSPTALIMYNTKTCIPEIMDQNGDAENERNSLENAFQDSGIQAVVLKDFSASEMADAIREALVPEDVSALIIFIMAHGDGSVLYDRNTEPTKVQTIINVISELDDKGIPKVLILQACQSKTSLDHTSWIKADLYAPEPYWLTKKDFLVVRTRLPSDQRDYFTSVLAKAIKESDKQEDIMDIFFRTSSILDTCGQMCEMSSTFRKRFCLKAFPNA